MISPEHFSHTKRIPLSVLEKALERDRYLIEKALHILSVEDPENTYTELSAVSGLLNHWLVNGELGYYINGQRGDDFLALTVIPVNGDYGRGLAALETWITIDNEDLVELLRSRNLIVPGNLLNAKADRTPNWDKWRLIPHANALQCVALSLNIDPAKVQGQIGGWLVGRAIFDESQEFKDRMEVVLANLYGELKEMERSAEEVNLRRFAAWVRAIGWDAPRELLAMADGDDPGKQKTPTPAAGRAHNKPKTEARNGEWQVRINQLAAMHPTNNHSDLCRKLVKELGDDGPSFQTIRKNTRLLRSRALL